MGNRDTKERRRQLEQAARLAAEAAEWERARTEPRRPAVGIHPPERGFRRLQLIVENSFDESNAWELRRDREWLLYHSRVVPHRTEVLLTGYDRIEIPSDLLGSYFARVTAVSLPLPPDLSRGGRLDGTGCELAVFGDNSSAWRVEWWSRFPAHRAQLVELDSIFNRARKAAAAERDNPFSNVPIT